MPLGLRRSMPECTVVHARELGWDKLGNGQLIDATEREDFAVLLTGDRNLRYQQNLPTRTLSIVVTSTNQWLVLFENIEIIRKAIGESFLGSYVEVPFPRPVLVRRPPPLGR